MGAASLVLGTLGLLLGLHPLLPGSGPLALLGTGLGALLGVLGLIFGLIGRSQALRSGRHLRLCTVALSLAVSATLVCASWLGGVYYLSRRVPPPGTRPPVPDLGTTEPQAPPPGPVTL